MARAALHLVNLYNLMYGWSAGRAPDAYGSKWIRIHLFALNRKGPHTHTSTREGGAQTIPMTGRQDTRTKRRPLHTHTEYTHCSGWSSPSYVSAVAPLCLLRPGLSYVLSCPIEMSKLIQFIVFCFHVKWFCYATFVFWLWPISK